MSSTTLNLRLSKELKQNAQVIIEKNGLDVPSAIRLFLSHVVSRGTIPLQWITINGFTEKAEQSIVKQKKTKDVAKTLTCEKDISDYIDEL